MSLRRALHAALRHRSRCLGGTLEVMLPWCPGHSPRRRGTVLMGVIVRTIMVDAATLRSVGGTVADWGLVEDAAKEKIARHRRPEKNQLVMTGPDRIPGRKQRTSVIYEGVPCRRSRSVHRSVSRAERILFSERIVTDDFITERDCRHIVSACENAIRGGLFLAQGPEVCFTPLQPEIEDLVGTFAYDKILTTLQRMRFEMMEDFRLPQLYCAGALVSRLSPRVQDAVPGYIDPHIDKANKKAYDLSAVLYLNSSGVDFEGGAFAFLDGDADRVVIPRAGRLLTFTSGFENPHQVQEVANGHRYALSTWLTTDKELAVRD